MLDCSADGSGDGSEDCSGGDESNLAGAVACGPGVQDSQQDLIKAMEADKSPELLDLIREEKDRLADKEKDL